MPPPSAGEQLNTYQGRFIVPPKSVDSELSKLDENDRFAKKQGGGDMVIL
jgi:hypothetical protein